MWPHYHSTAEFTRVRFHMCILRGWPGVEFRLVHRRGVINKQRLQRSKIDSSRQKAPNETKARPMGQNDSSKKNASNGARITPAKSLSMTPNDSTQLQVTPIRELAGNDSPLLRLISKEITCSKRSQQRRRPISDQISGFYVITIIPMYRMYSSSIILGEFSVSFLKLYMAVRQCLVFNLERDLREERLHHAGVNNTHLRKVDIFE